jgi:3-hydroxybutyryl-CoA dehydratase
VAPLSREVTREAIAAYADAVGDHNPIHVDEAFARATPFGGVIAHGMLALAYVSETMERAFGERWARSGRLKVRFKLPARPGDTLIVTAEPRSTVDEGAGGTRWEYAVTCANQRGETLIAGSASVEAE